MWDEGRRLEEVRVGNTVEAEFLYAIDDRRVRRIADGVATYYLADGSEYTIDGTDSYFTYFHSVNGRMVAFTKSDTDVTTWMGADIVNSTSNTRDENGVTAQQRYTPFGEVRIDGNLATDHTYTGQVNDETTGLAFYNARYYDPATARFITPDSIVPNPNDGQDYNRYSYVRNNPVKYNDPSGFEPCRLDGACTERGDTGFDGPTPSTSSHSSASNNQGAPPLQQAGIVAIEPGEILRDVVYFIFGSDPAPRPQAPWEIVGLTQGEWNICTSTASGSVSYDFCDVAGIYGTHSPYVPTGGSLSETRGCSGFTLAVLCRNSAPILPSPGDDVVVIGKVDDLNATQLAPGEWTLLDQLPNQGSPRANYVQNDSVLRTEISRGVPIRDASVSPTTGELVNNTGCLRAERDILLNHGWSFDTKSGYWLLPGQAG